MGSDKTEGKIKDIVEELSSDVVLVLASAALFKGSWKNPFNKAKNTTETFTNSDGTKVKVTMMNMEVDQLKMAYDLHENLRVEILELPFHGDVSLFLIDADEDWKNMSEYMTQKSFQSLIDDREKRFHKARGLSLGIPKLDLSDKTDLFEELKHNDLTKKITEADFSSMFENTGRINTPQLVSEVKFVMMKKEQRLQQHPILLAMRNPAILISS